MLISAGVLSPDLPFGVVIFWGLQIGYVIESMMTPCAE